MANSGTVTAGSAALASQYNNLRDDVLNVSTGHTHTGASENGAKVAATGVSSGTAALNAVLTADGSGGASFLALAAAGADVQEFTSSGSWVKPAGKSAVFVIAIGGGGGGASGAINTSGEAFGGSGGGGGAHGARWMVASTLAGTVTITVGAGGAGATAIATGSVAASGVNGTNGGDTSFGTVVVGIGGLGGAFTTNTTVAQRGVGITEWGAGLDPTVSATARTSDAVSSTNSWATGDTFGIAQALSPGRGGVAFYGSARSSTRTGGGGAGGFRTNGILYFGCAGGRGFGFDGTIASGGTGGTTTAGAGQSATEGLGNAGGGGGCVQNGTAGAGGNGYLGGGGGGGGAAFRSAGDVRPGAGGTGGAGYILVISV